MVINKIQTQPTERKDYCPANDNGKCNVDNTKLCKYKDNYVSCELRRDLLVQHKRIMHAEGCYS